MMVGYNHAGQLLLDAKELFPLLNYYQHAKIILSDVFSHMTYPCCQIRYALGCATLAMLCLCFIKMRFICSLRLLYHRF